MNGSWFGWEGELMGGLWWCMIKHMGDENYKVQ
jgi:hypothetical protein